MLMPLAFPEDAPRERADVICQLLEFAFGKKPSGTWIYSAESARAILEMYDIMGDEIKGPPFYILEPISPLQFPRHGLEISLLFAQKGLPVFVGPMAQSGLTAPITPAGTIVIQNAENLATLVLLDLIGGLPLLCYGGSAHAPDMRSMVCSFGSPNNILMALGLLQMSRRYGLAFACNMGLTDAMLPDFQGGFEKGVQMALAMTGGGYLASFGMQGIVGPDQGASLEQLVIDDEWLSYLNYVCNGMTVSRETIGLDTILQVGIGGNFVSETHTAEHLRACYWRPSLFNRDAWDQWQAKGRKDILALAHERVEEILSRHYPPEPILGIDKLAKLESLAGFRLPKTIF
jgi:trimethylamine--corrinoid protein Co-methyltransferase